jgi:hypothetical protein
VAFDDWLTWFFSVPCLSFRLRKGPANIENVRPVGVSFAEII